MGVEVEEVEVGDCHRHIHGVADEAGAARVEAANNLAKRVKRGAFGYTNFANYRIRTLLYTGKPNWALLETLTPT
ncbi:MAG: transposase [Acidimicrobiaceae bacterium]|nr:transposase [Acidimicrobiia bacterium]MCY4492280.1 transposase [Acidimicrobiaceae bacterium]